MNDFINAGLAIATAIVGLAIIAVIVSKNSNTPNVITSLANGLSGLIKSAVSPVSGGYVGLSTSLDPISLGSGGLV